MIDRKWIGHEMAKSILPIERGRLKFFARAIGETDPIYTEEQAARAAGYADIPAPPTFLFAAQMDSGAKFALFEQLHVPLARILHGEQSFEYLAPVVAGDEITVSAHITDIYDKRNGALEFLVIEEAAVNQHGVTAAKFRNVTIIRN